MENVNSRNTDPATSHQAEAKIKRSRQNTDKKAVFDLIASERNAWPNRDRYWEYGGYSDAEGAEKLGWTGEQYRKRRCDLKADGIVTNSGRTRMGPRGALMIVWILSMKGEAAAGIGGGP